MDSASENTMLKKSTRPIISKEKFHHQGAVYLSNEEASIRGEPNDADKGSKDKPKESELTDNPNELDRSKNLDSEGGALEEWKDDTSDPKAND